MSNTKTPREWMGIEINQLNPENIYWHRQMKAYHEYVMEQKIEELEKQLKYPDHDEFGRGQYDGIEKAIEILKK